LHLGANFSGLPGHIGQRRKQDMMESFKKIIDLCEKMRADLLLIAGDLFDDVVPRDELVEIVRMGFADIYQTTVVIAAGNHDAALPDSPYNRKNFWPANVITFNGDIKRASVPLLDCAIWGAGFVNIYQDECMLKNPKLDDEQLNICVMHGELTVGEARSPYNPISRDAVSASGLDYLALGHIHKRGEILRIGDTFVGWPGSMEPLGFDEQGEHGVYVGEIYKGGHTMEFVPLARRLYADIHLDVTGLAREETMHYLKDRIISLPGGYENLAKITLTGLVEDILLNEDYIADGLASVFYLSVRDMTDSELPTDAKEFDLKSVFARKMRKLINESPGDESLRLALKLGLAALNDRTLSVKEVLT
jgi:DNA repair exonuclease SbcCD nuclease subunit